MRALLRSLLLALLALPAHAELVVVVGAGTGIGKMSQDEVIDIFLGRYRRLPDGSAAAPIDQPADAPARAAFYRLLAGKELAEINAYWARLYFSGKTSPPRQAASVAEVLAHVAGKRGGIGYLERGQLDARARIVLSLPEP